MNNSKLEVGFLDFDSIKASLRDYLKSQTQFRDYDFEGSGLSVLIDLLAYNTHYNGFYLHMVSNQMFLDSADRRSSVVSLAKHLSYTPRSIKSAETLVNLVVTPSDDAASIVVEKNTKFTSSVDGVTYTFVTDRAYGANLTDGAFVLNNVRLVEGLPYTYRWIVNSRIPDQRFVLPNANVDTKTITVRVQNSVSDLTLETYKLVDDITEVTADSRAYFLQEVEDGRYEVYFGDGVIGRKLTDNNVVLIDYLLSAGPDANKCAIFRPADYVGIYPPENVVVTALTPAHGGAVAETIEQIKFAAPKNYEAQNRAVTVQDYKSLIQKDYPNVESVAIWGGEQNVPPAYGKVFLSVKPVEGFVLTETMKSTITNDILRRRNIVSIIPEMLDPDYTYVLVDCKVKYNPSGTFKSQGDIKNGVFQTIVNFGKAELSKFDRILKYSKLIYAIDSSDTSISNNLTTLRMQKRFKPALNVKANYEFQLNNAIEPGTLVSSSFVVAQDPVIAYTNGDTHRFQDDRNGKVNIIATSIGKPEKVAKTVGTIDYATGIIKINEFIPFQADENAEIRLTMNPVENDITPLRNNILVFDSKDISVTVIGLPLSQV